MISTHILDTTLGAPASGIKVSLQKLVNNDWQEIDSQKTNLDGRILFSCPYEEGQYRLTFFTEDYFLSREHFFINPQIDFYITDTHRKYHVPIILNPYGYSTYRGS
jgi:5-hydroxyisourate hydrolase